jgi:hypothetical protein
MFESYSEPQKRYKFPEDFRLLIEYMGLTSRHEIMLFHNSGKESINSLQLLHTCSDEEELYATKLVFRNSIRP